jgi:integrative and conjugative element protein (TIGR02256 family)
MSMRFEEKVSGPGIILTDEALSSMFKYRQLCPTAKEGGGQLFAKFIGTDIIIVEATTPKILDKRTRCGFKPNRMLQQIEIWDRHRKGLHFVGDWHTHPEKVPRPSGRDIIDMAECYQLSTHVLRAFIMIIIGTQRGPQGVYAALINQQGAIDLTTVI